jgi:hypothetical protein
MEKDSWKNMEVGNSLRTLKKGDIIKVGDPIGKVDNSGGSDGDHVHFIFAPNSEVYGPEGTKKPEGRINPIDCMEDEPLYEIAFTWPRPETDVWGGEPATIACHIRYLGEPGSVSPEGKVIFYINGKQFAQTPFDPIDAAELRYVPSGKSYTPPNPFNPTSDDPFEDSSFIYEVRVVVDQIVSKTREVIVKYNPVPVFGPNNARWVIEFTHETHYYETEYGIFYDRYSRGSGFTQRSGTTGPFESLFFEQGSWTQGQHVTCSGSFDFELDDSCLRFYNTGGHSENYQINLRHKWHYCDQFQHSDYSGCYIQGGTCEGGGESSVSCNRFNLELPFKSNKLGPQQIDANTIAEVSLLPNGHPRVEITREYDFQKPEGDYNYLKTHIVVTRTAVVPGGKSTIGPVLSGSPEHKQAALHQIYPNPFNPATSIGFELPTPLYTKVMIYDVKGELVRTLIPGSLFPAGNHTVSWNGRDDKGNGVASGVYFCRLLAGDLVSTKRLVLLK